MTDFQHVIFVVGIGRSGTSLLQSMLNAHPEVCFPPETAFVRRYVATGLLEAVHRGAGPAGVVDHLLRDEQFSRLGLDETELGRIVSEQTSPFDAGRFYLFLLRFWAAKKGKASWCGDKDPRCVEFLPTVHKCLPHAHVLHIIRDPRDVLASKKRAAWSRSRSAWRHVFANRVQLGMGRRDGSRLFGERYVELCYEELIAEPARVLRTVCSRIGLEFHQGMLDFEASSRELVADDEIQWKKETLGPILPQNTGKWAESLTPWEIALTERVCGEAFDVTGQQRSDARSRLGILARAWLWFSATLLSVADPAYRAYRRWRQR